ncbi:putative HNHc nuclease [Levilactobacillus brevis]|uniref:putative HNHc nuclease n=1 Tax=Levilactobacillus brevis TaxID=1580 RepID=UPI003AFA347C
MQLFLPVEKDSDGKLLINLSDVDPPTRRIIAGNVGQLAEIKFDDGRHITIDQRKKIFVLLGEIDQWTGNFTMDITERQMKQLFISEKGLDEEFSFSDCSLKLASEFIEFLIGACFEYDIPFAGKTLDAIREQYGWDMFCIKYHRCMICNQPADIAHVHAVGIGRDRNHISHIGNYVMALCRRHHQEQHRVGIKSFMKENQLKGVKVTPEIAKMLRLGNWQQEQGQNLRFINAE